MGIHALSEIRKAQGITQEDLASAIGVKRAIISKYENGSVSPSIDTLEKISNAVGVPVHFLLPGHSDAQFVTSVGKRIRLARKQKRMTQKNLAIAAGVAEISIRQYEANKREPKIAQLEKIANALDVPISSLVPCTSSGEVAKAAYDNIPIMTKFTNCILSMSPDDKFYIALDTLLDAIQEQNEQ